MNFKVFISSLLYFEMDFSIFVRPTIGPHSTSRTHAGKASVVSALAWVEMHLSLGVTHTDRCADDADISLDFNELLGDLRPTAHCVTGAAVGGRACRLVRRRRRVLGPRRSKGGRDGSRCGGAFQFCRRA